MLRTRNALKNQSKGNNSKTEQGRVTVLVYCTSSHCQSMHTMFRVIWFYDDKVTLLTRKAGRRGRGHERGRRRRRGRRRPKLYLYVAFSGDTIKSGQVNVSSEFRIY